MESIQQPSVLAMPFANNGTKNNIPSSPTGTNKASLSEGFPQITSTAIASGGIPPERADMNALGNIATMFYYFMQCGGAYTFRADVSSTIGGYPKGALLWYIPATGIPNLLASTINNNTNNFNTDQSVIGEAGSGKPWEIVTVSPLNFMDLLSNQTAAGEKTFTSTPTFKHDNSAIRLLNPNATKGTSPSSNKYGYVEYLDKNGSGNANRIGLLEFSQKPNGDSVTLLAAYKDVAGSTERAEIGLVQKRDGTAFATAPTPAAGDSSNKIATTEFVKNLIKAIFPVGSIYSTIGNTNPNTILGFGTWSLVTSSIVAGSSNPTVWGDGTHALGLEYYDKNANVSKYGTMQQSAKHDYSNGSNVGTSLGIAYRTTDNNLSDNYNNIGGQGYNGYSSGYGANVVSKGNGISGLYADMSTIKTTIYIWKRTA